MSQPVNSASPSEVTESHGVYIQVVPAQGGGTTPQSVRSTLKQFSPDQLKALGSIVGDVQAWLSTKLNEMTPRPNAFSLEFGIDAEGEAGIPFITKGSIAANFKVKMEWK